MFDEDRTASLRWIRICPTGQGWNVRVQRVWTGERIYHRVSAASIKRIEHILNRDDYDNFVIVLGLTGWAEIELYPDKALRGQHPLAEKRSSR